MRRPRGDGIATRSADETLLNYCFPPNLGGVWLLLSQLFATGREAAHEGSRVGKSRASAHAQQTAAPCSSPGRVPNFLTTTGLSPPAEVPPTLTRKFSNPVQGRKGKLPAPDPASTRWNGCGAPRCPIPRAWFWGKSLRFGLGTWYLAACSPTQPRPRSGRAPFLGGNARVRLSGQGQTLLQAGKKLLNQ